MMQKVLPILILAAIVAGGCGKVSAAADLVSRKGFDHLDRNLIVRLDALADSKLSDELKREATSLLDTFDIIDKSLDCENSYHEKLINKLKKLSKSQNNIFYRTSGHDERGLIRKATSLMMALPGAARECDDLTEDIMAMLYLALKRNDGRANCVRTIFVDYARSWHKRCPV